MKKAFTLIELLVVIAIIAILAAILFPVFAQAKLAAKKTVDLSNMKQMSIASFMYFTDYDDTLFLYRTTTSNPEWNPFWNNPNVGTGACSNSSSSEKQFWNQLLNPYTKNYDMFLGPGVTNAWVNIEPTGGTQAGPGGDPDCSYGGQNSYGVNRIVFNANQPAMNASTLVDTSNTLIITDTTYYDVMPKMTGHDGTNAWAPKGLFTGDPAQTLYYSTENSDCGYYNYWVQLGGSACDAAGFPSVAPQTPAQDSAYITLVARRNGGQLNCAFADSHAKSFPTLRVVYDLVDNGNNHTSFWDPWKQGVQ